MKILRMLWYIYIFIYDDGGLRAELHKFGKQVVNVSPIPTSRIIPSHPSALILGDPTSAVQTRSKVNKSSEAHAFVSYVQKQRRNNHKDFHHCFFKIQKVWILVDLPYGKRLSVQSGLYQNKRMKEEESVVGTKLDWWLRTQARRKVSKILRILRKSTKWLKLCMGYIKLPEHVQVYVDDIIFGSTKKSWCDEFEALMKSRFQMSSMGELTFFLGLQVKQKPDGIFISQDKYVAEILKKFDFASVKTQKPLVKDEEASDVDVHLYRSMIGSLMYVTASRPDIMFASCAVLGFKSFPKTSHLSDVKEYWGNPQQEVVNFLAGDSLLGNAKSKPLWPLLQQKPNMLLLQVAVGKEQYEWVILWMKEFKSKKIAQVVRAWIQSKILLVKHFEDMRLCRPFKEYLHVWFNPPRDVSMSCLTTKRMHTIGAVCTREEVSLKKDNSDANAKAKLESEEESNMALDLIRFIKQGFNSTLLLGEELASPRSKQFLVKPTQESVDSYNEELSIPETKATVAVKDVVNAEKNKDAAKKDRVFLPPPLFDYDTPFTAELSENLKENISIRTLLVFKEPSFLLPPPEPQDECLNFEPILVMKNVVLNEAFYQSNVEDFDSLTLIIWTFLPHFTYPKESPLIFSFRSENFVFDPGIVTFLKSVAFSMEVSCSKCCSP
ncbi:putative ribonuclease H-like domain-containing protein [Tanacetum coccineum]